MTLSRKIADALDRHGPYAGAVSAEYEGNLLGLDIREGGPVGLAVDALSFQPARREGWAPEALKGWGDQLVARLSYLMEPIRVVEVDREAAEVQLRSATPTPRDGGRSYYEITLKETGALALRRWRFDEADRRREAIPCQFTREVVERLADDLVATST